MRTDTKNVVAVIAYLIGVKKSAWAVTYQESCPELLAELEKNQDATVMRYLCKLRTMLMRNFMKTDNSIRFDLKNIDRIEWFDKENIQQLEQWGFEIVLTNKRSSDYSLHFNRLINENIEKCRTLFPDWIAWEYIKNLFLIPKYTKEQNQKYEFEKYMAHFEWYPYQMYIHWKPQDLGNILYTDGKFIELLYQMNGDYFADSSKYKGVVNDVKDNIYDFIQKSYKTILVVDCENSDVYKLYGALNSLNQTEIQKIQKIILYDDSHTTNGWDYFEKFVSIPVEHIEVERVTDRKSLVDIRVTAGICQAFYRDDVSSFILLSSDSDYWGLISSLPEADFLVMIEYSKCGHAIQQALEEHSIYYCSLDDFCSGYIDELKRTVLIQELKKYLPDITQYNGKELAHTLFAQARIEADETEIVNFYEKYIKTIRLKIDADGNFRIELSI